MTRSVRWMRSGRVYSGDAPQRRCPAGVGDRRLGGTAAARRITARLLVTGRSPGGRSSPPFHFAEAAANVLTDNRVDRRLKDSRLQSMRRAHRPLDSSAGRAGADTLLTDRGTIRTRLLRRSHQWRPMPAKDVSKPASDTFGQLERAIEMLRGFAPSKDFPVAYRAILDDCMGELDSARSGFGHRPPKDVADVLLSASKVQGAGENASDMIVRFDRDHRYLYVNPIIEEVTGAPAELFLGKTNYRWGSIGPVGSLAESWTGSWRPESRERFRFDGPTAGERYYRPRY